MYSRLGHVLKTNQVHTERQAKQICQKPNRWFFTLEGAMQSVNSFTENVLKQCAQRIDPAITQGLQLAISELLLNAIEHGNLRITYTEKAKALISGNYYDLLAKRERSILGKEMRINVEIERDNHKISVKIQDEGEGFNWRDLPDPSDPENLLSENGRGLYLAWACVDSLTFNKKGNTVTIVKFLNI